MRVKADKQVARWIRSAEQQGWRSSPATSRLFNASRTSSMAAVIGLSVEEVLKALSE